ncbi:MAG: hypothetical protein PHD76_12175 [Methylacidiphilales bacterium]|nr:hypothetical protein [Candidatus Methylacidiphilales bacterium]
MKIRLILPSCALAALAAALLFPNTASAQVEDENPYDPSLGLAFPLKQDTGRVIVSQKVLLNYNVILQPGYVARVIFQRPEAHDRDVVLKNKKKSLEDTYSRQPTKLDRPDASAQSAIAQAAAQRANKNYWKDEMLFRGLLHKMNLENYFLVFEVPGSPDLLVEQLQLPEDLLLGEIDGKIYVLTLAKESIARKKGIVSGAQLLAYNGVNVKSLEDFRDRYLKEKEEYRNAGKPLSMTFLLKDKTEPTTINFKTPHSLDDNPLLMDLPGQK